MAMSSDGVRKLRDDIAKMSDQGDAFLRKFLLQMGMRVLANTKQRTPVDKGDLRDHWTLSQIKEADGCLMIELINPMTYASHVEYGHRQEVGRFVPAIGKRLKNPWVDGYFMATISIQQLEREMPARLKAAWNRYYRNMRGGR